MRMISGLQNIAKQHMGGMMLILLISAISIVAQTGTQRPLDVRQTPPLSTGSGIGAATGAGIGAATGTGIGAATGHGLGRANGTGIGGGPKDVVILAPSGMNVFKTRNKKPNATDMRSTGIGVNAGRGVARADETTSGIGEATGNGTTGDSRPPVEKPEPKRDYMQETDGRCFYVTNMGEKQYVLSDKCKIE